MRAEPRAADDGRRGEPARARGRALLDALRWAEPGGVVVVAVLAWEITSRAGLLPRRDFPPATRILSAFLTDIRQRELWTGVGASMRAWVLGMLVIIAIGVPVGMLLGSSSVSYKLTYLTLEFIRTLPGIAALPILMFAYGVGQPLVISLVVLAGIWPLLIQSMYGMHDIDPVAVATAKVYGVGRVRRFALVDLPSCAPYIATGLRVSGTFALIFAIGASLVVGGQGLGDAMAEAARVGDRSLLFARVLACGLLGLGVALTLLALERRALRWHASQREAAR
ncbi:ABC transporter permease subunit [Actinomadura sp. LD22]|uniref:ABC transporter permease subunit n=1 Tax=Actinomadura physcomitrii TaxID=2650748 RepID=A0A6I4MNA3_9ACTN|nr:ABC transporter permease subunit [Actinomadura physcomitrii]MWA04931.1 ABC transporter permease subunit [Actinomadura physcomitrii]